MEIIKTSSNNEKILLYGFIYTKLKTYKFYIRWKCSKYSSLKCPAILTTTFEYNDPKITNEHVHLSDVSSTKAAKIVYEIKERSKVCENTQSQIFSEAVYNLPKDVLMNMPKENTMKRLIRNRRRGNDTGVENNLNELKIEGKCTNIV